jgi:hypothetical protein
MGKEIGNKTKASTAVTLQTNKTAPTQFPPETIEILAEVTVESSTLSLNKSTISTTTEEIFTFHPLDTTTQKVQITSENSLKVDESNTTGSLLENSTPIFNSNTERIEKISSVGAENYTEKVMINSADNSAFDSSTTDSIEETFTTTLRSIFESLTSTKSFEKDGKSNDSVSSDSSENVEYESNSCIETSTQSVSTDFFSESPKNVLLTSTEKVELTSKILSIDESSDETTATEGSIDLNDVDDETKGHDHKKGTTVHQKDDDDFENEQKVNEQENQIIHESTEMSIEPFYTKSGFDITKHLTIFTTESNQDSENNVFELTATSQTERTFTSFSTEKQSSEKSTKSVFEISTKVDMYSTETSNGPTVLVNTQNYDNEIMTDDDELMNNATEISNATRKPKFKNFFYYYFITSIKANESRVKEIKNSTEELEGDPASFMGIPGEQSCEAHQKFLPGFV